MSDIISGPTMGVHDAAREGVRLGLVVATATWLRVGVLDAASGRPFRTLQALGGVVPFTAIHYALCLTYGVVLVIAVRGAEREPGLVVALLVGATLLQAVFAMLTTRLAAIAGENVTWPGTLGGSLLVVSFAFVLLARTHPVHVTRRRADAET